VKEKGTKQRLKNNGIEREGYKKLNSTKNRIKSSTKSFAQRLKRDFVHLGKTLKNR
jgi:hypothetical protein